MWMQAEEMSRRFAEEAKARGLDPMTGKPLEADPNGKTAHELGAKMDSNKSPVWRGVLDYFPLALMEVARVSEAGAKKYAWKGWEHVPDGETRYRDAFGRHILNESIEGEYDPEGFLHLAQIAWNSLAALELKLRNRK